MAAVVATSSVAYAAPEATIVMTWPGVEPQITDQINFIETEWSESVNIDYSTELTLLSVNRDASVSGHFVENEMGASTFVYIQLDSEVVDPGRYVMIIPEGVLFNGETLEASMATNVATTLNFVIEESQGDVSEEKVLKIVSTDPEDGATVTSLSVIHLKFDGPVDYGFFETVPVIKDGKEEVATALVNYDEDDEWAADKAQLNIDPEITAQGTYTITIPAGLIGNNDQNSKLEECTLTYYIGEGGSGNDTPGDDSNVVYDFNPIEVLPENGAVIDDNDGKGLSNLSSININFSAFPYVKEGFEFVFTNENGETFLSSKPSSTGEEGETVNYVTNAIFGNMILLGLENIPSGKYTLTVPKGMIGDKAWAKSGYTAGSCNEEFTYTWDYTAKKVVEIPEEIIKAPLEIEVLTLTLPTGEIIDLLDNPAIEGIPAGTTFNILTNKNEYAQSLRLEIKDNHNGEILWNIWTTPSKEELIPSIGIKGEDGLFHFEKAGAEIFYENRTYTLLIAAYENFEVPESEKIFLQESEIEIKGLAESIKYSEVEIEDVTPEPGSLFDNDNHSFTVTYSGPVEIVTSGDLMSGYVVAYMGIQPFESITSNEDKTEWTFTIPESELVDCLGGGIICDIVANDMEGQRVYPEFYDYNMENGDSGFQQYTFNSFLGLPTVTVSPAAGEVESLYTFEFTCPGADKESIGVQGIDHEGNALEIVLIDTEGNTVATVDRKNYVEVASNGQVLDENNEDFNVVVTKVIMHLDKEVTTPGEYTLVIPATYFMTGTEYLAYGNCPQEITYTVGSTTGVASIAANGAEVSVANGEVVVAGAEGAVEVYAVNGAKVASVAAQGGNAVIALEKGIYVVVVNGKSVKVVL